MQQEREMNFFDLCKACANGIGRACRAFWNLLVKMIRLSYRQWWIVLIFVVAALVAANFYARRDNRRYKVEAVVILNGPTVEMTEQVFRNFSLAAAPYISARQNLPALLQLSPEELKGISRFKSFPVIDCLHDSVADYVDYKLKSSPLDTLSVRMPNRLCLQFQTKHPLEGERIGEAMIAYLNAQPQMQKAFERKRAIQERKVEFARNQIEKLDSLTSAFYFKQGTGQQAQAALWEKGFVLGRREIKLFTPTIYEEIERYTKADYELAFCTAPVVVENSFIVYPKPVNGRIKTNVIGLLIGWILGCIVAALIEQRKAIASWLKK